VTTPSAGNPITTEYVLDNAWHGARERLRLLEETLDPGTIRHLETVGVASGWRCLEVGGGGGSITAWLCQRVGPEGRVVATDIDTRFLKALNYPNLEVRQQNIVTDAIDEAAFDLVHTRAVLMHLPERQRALDRLVAALKPGGWLLLEEGDYVSHALPDPRLDAEAAELLAKHKRAMDIGTAKIGSDIYYGRRLYGDLLARGIVDIKTEGRLEMTRGGSTAAKFLQVTGQQTRQQPQAGGQMSEAERDAFLTLLDDPALLYLGPILMAAWGRMPLA
jgi:SAM-dependent methyltransferase